MDYRLFPPLDVMRLVLSAICHEAVQTDRTDGSSHPALHYDLLSTMSSAAVTGCSPIWSQFAKMALHPRRMGLQEAFMTSQRVSRIPGPGGRPRKGWRP